MISKLIQDLLVILTRNLFHNFKSLGISFWGFLYLSFFRNFRFVNYSIKLIGMKLSGFWLNWGDILPWFVFNIFDEIVLGVDFLLLNIVDLLKLTVWSVMYFGGSFSWSRSLFIELSVSINHSLDKPLNLLKFEDVWI